MYSVHAIRQAAFQVLLELTFYIREAVSIRGFSQFFFQYVESAGISVLIPVCGLDLDTQAIISPECFIFPLGR